MKNLPEDIDKLILYKKQKLAIIDKILTFCSYFHIFSGIFLLVLVMFGGASQGLGSGIIIMLLSIPFFLIGYLATYSSRKEIAFIIGWYIVIWLAHKNYLITFSIGLYFPIMVVGIILTFVCAYLGNKHKQIEKIEIPIETIMPNKNGNKFRDI